MSKRPTIVWFRRDLRLSDNPALMVAVRMGGPIIPVYLAEWERDDLWAPGEAARWWLRRSLSGLADDLARGGTSLRVVGGEPVSALTELALATGAREVLWNRLYEPHSRELDRKVEAALRDAGVASRDLAGSLLFDPEEHLSRAGRPFVQFGAFWRSCQSLPEPAEPGPRPALVSGALPGIEVQASVGAVDGFPAPTSWAPTVGETADSWEPGEAGARKRLERFLERALATYETSRDFPGIEGVSRLSPHLHFGEISPHQVWYAARGAERPRGKAAGADGGAAFLRQLGWREFAHYLLYHFPATPAEPFRPEFAAFPWADDPEGLAAWQRGATGYPLVDAGMRQLLAEGWMHNRVRMVVASFLTKDLMIPWQRGAAWFWDRLVDADLANNTLGWQWTAGSGPDAAPYFRIYNPALQARRFDAENTYVRRWSGPARLEVAPQADEQTPIVDHAAARLRALEAFRGLRGR
ncbi:MAG: deoxyribodipyrimidine photo-lyase [bacterium]